MAGRRARLYWKCSECEAIHNRVVYSHAECAEVTQDLEDGGIRWVQIAPLSEPVAGGTLQ